MSNRVWPFLIVMLFATALAGCGDDTGDNAADGGDTKAPAGPAPTADGTLTDDAAKPRMDIPRIRKWETYAKEYSEKNNGQEPPEPRTRDDIHDGRRRIPRLYLTHETLTRVTAPGNLRVHRDPETGEMCSPALGCYNPECPGRGVDGEPFAFIAENRQVTPQAVDDPSAPGAKFARDPMLLGVVCPACIAVRDLASETVHDRERYARWVHPHELPEVLPLMRELTEEHRRRIAWERAHR